MGVENPNRSSNSAHANPAEAVRTIVDRVAEKPFVSPADISAVENIVNGERWFPPETTDPIKASHAIGEEVRADSEISKMKS